MPDYEETGPVALGAEAVFAYVSDVAHLTEYVPNMIQARSEDDHLQVAAEVQGRHEEGAATFRADDERGLIEWGGSGPGGYRGWLQVSGSSETSSTVTIHLSTDREEDAEEIRRSLSQALENIRKQVEGA